MLNTMFANQVVTCSYKRVANLPDSSRDAKFYVIVFESFASWRICGKKKKYDFSE
jgi:hypothetical protein